MVDYQRSEELRNSGKFPPKGSLELGRTHADSHLRFLSCGLFDVMFPFRLPSEAIQSSLGVSSANGFCIVDSSSWTEKWCKRCVIHSYEITMAETTERVRCYGGGG